MNVEVILNPLVCTPTFKTHPVVPSETSHLVLSLQELWDQLSPALKAPDEMNAAKLVKYYQNEGNSQPAGSYQFTKSRKPNAIVLVIHKGGTESALCIKYEWTEWGWIRKANEQPHQIMGVTIYYGLEGILNDAKYYAKLCKIQSIARANLVEETKLAKKRNLVFSNENDPLYPVKTAADFFKYLDAQIPGLKCADENAAQLKLKNCRDGDCVFIPSAQTERLENQLIRTHAVDIVVKDSNSKNLSRTITLKRQANLDYWYAETHVGVLSFNNLQNIFHFARFNDVYIFCHGKQFRTVQNGVFPFIDERLLRHIRGEVFNHLMLTYFPSYSQTKILKWFCPMKT